MRVAINAIPLTDGGGKIVLLGYLEAFRRRFPDLEIVALASRPETLSALTNFNIRVIKAGNGSSLLTRLYEQYLHVGRMVAEHRCDLLLSTNSAVPQCPVPQIVHHQNLWNFEVPQHGKLPLFARLRPYLLRSAGRNAIKVASANVFVSAYLRRVAERLYPESVRKNHLIYNGLSQADATCAISRISAWSGEPLICSLSHGSPHKDNETAVRALAILVKRAPNVRWQLVFAGGGNWKSAIQLARDLRVHERTKWIGYAPREEIAKLLQQSLCLLFTSYFESFGNPPIEAMAHGCPVIATNATAIPEIVGGAGLLVPPCDPFRAAECVWELFQSPEQRRQLVAKGHARAALFTWDQSVERFYRVFQQTLKLRVK